MRASPKRGVARTFSRHRSKGITMFNNVGFIGSGPIAQALAHHLVAAQIPLYISNSRGPDSLTDLVADLGDPAQAVTVEQAAGADLVILALPFLRVPELVDVVADRQRMGCPSSARCDDHQGVQRDVRQLPRG
jgi:shikimate 5-dehydrogenase